MISFAEIKKSPITFALRAFALVIILALACFNIILTPMLIQRQRYGVIKDISLETTVSEDGGIIHSGFIDSASLEANKMGVAYRDTVLNPEVNTPGDVGTPVTFLIKSGNAPAREVTLIRKPYNEYDYILPAFVEAHPIVGLRLESTFLWGSVIFTGLFSVVAFCLGLDALMAFLTVVALSYLSALLLPPGSVFFRYILPSAVIFLFIHFPSGRLSPRWSWLLIFLPVSRLIYTVILDRAPSIIVSMLPVVCLSDFCLENNFSSVIVLIIFGVIVYRYRNSLTLAQRKRLNWLILGLILIFSSHQLYQVYYILKMPSHAFSWMSTVIWFNDRYVLYETTYFTANKIIYSVAKTFLYLGTTSAIIIWGFSVYRYVFIFTPIERQQAKWIVLGLIPTETLLMVSYMFFAYYYSTDDIVLIIGIIKRFMGLELTVVALSFLFALLRIRLYDVDRFINRALVYSGLLITASVAHLSATAFIDYTLGQISHNQKAFLVIPISIFLIAVTFKPVRSHLQKLADKFFKPEGFDIAETFFEFTPEMRVYFTLPELSKVLVTKSVEQLGVDYASVFLKNKNGNLQYTKSASIGRKTPRPSIEPQTLSLLEKGELVVQDSVSPYSITIPLVLARSRRPDLIGALVLGARLNGLGYPTEMKKSLRQLGEEVGKSLYVVRSRKRR
jgi:hypothetical protein